jgi:hypothetical protein
VDPGQGRVADVTEDARLARELGSLRTGANTTAELRTGAKIVQHLSSSQQVVGSEWVDRNLSDSMQGGPDEAILELVDRFGLEASTTAREDVRSLDTLPEPLRTALTHLVSSFLDLQRAAEASYQDASIPLVTEGLPREPDQGYGPWSTVGGNPSRPAAGPMLPFHAAATSIPGGDDTHRPDNLAEDFAAVVPERNQLLEATVRLEHAATSPSTESGVDAAAASIDLCPAVALDLQGKDSTYEDDCALIVDLGGNDTYHNNAGGSNLEDGDDSCRVGAPAVAAVVDLGAADDEYGDPEDPRSCGANGGGFAGVGVLVDEGGDDTYAAAHHGVNGGATGAGLGLLIDGGGSDRYDASSLGANGGAFGLASGFLVDLGGDDRFRADRIGVNGGGAGLAAGPSPHGGHLVSLGGNDVYSAGSGATNGGGASGGSGFLADYGGNDVYRASDAGVNGGGFAGAGLLFDATGDDSYTAKDGGTNGGAFLAGVGHLEDLEGDDVYAAGGGGANGGGYVAASGTLVDRTGDDRYTGSIAGVNGGAALAGSGLLRDGAGSDTYRADAYGTNGGAYWSGAGRLVDVAGDDVYETGPHGGNGATAGRLVGTDTPGEGLLHDGTGSDVYRDPALPGGSCQDCTVVPKGHSGAQVDAIGGSAGSN